MKKGFDGTGIAIIYAGSLRHEGAFLRSRHALSGNCAMSWHALSVTRRMETSPSIRRMMQCRHRARILMKNPLYIEFRRKA
jgi:hypothetical protein